MTIIKDDFSWEDPTPYDELKPGRNLRPEFHEEYAALMDRSFRIGSKLYDQVYEALKVNNPERWEVIHGRLLAVSNYTMEKVLDIKLRSQKANENPKSN